MAGERGRYGACRALPRSFRGRSGHVRAIHSDVLERGSLRIGILKLGHCRHRVDGRIRNRHPGCVPHLIDDGEAVIGVDLNDEQVFQLTSTSRGEFTAQPLLIAMSQLKVVSRRLTVRGQNVADAALALFANHRGTVGFALDEADVAQRENAHPAQLSQKLDRVKLVVRAVERILGEAFTFDNRVCLSYDERARRHECRHQVIESRNDREGYEQDADVLGE